MAAPRWSDAEKLALLLSIHKASGVGSPQWSKVDVPQGRTLQSSQKIYEQIVKTGASVVMTSGQNITPSKKRARPAGGATAPKKKDGAVVSGGSPVKNKRAPGKNGKASAKGIDTTFGASDDEVDDEEDFGGDVKKVKKEEDEGNGFIGDDIDRIAAERGSSDDTV